MKKVSGGNVTIEVRRETIRNRMHRLALATIAMANIEEITKQLGFDVLYVENLVLNFAAISPRVKVTKGKLDFEFPAHNTTPEQFIVCFNGYLDSEHAVLMDKIVHAVNDLDRAQDSDLLPGIVIPDDEKKS